MGVEAAAARVLPAYSLDPLGAADTNVVRMTAQLAASQCDAVPNFGANIWGKYVTICPETSDIFCGFFASATQVITNAPTDSVAGDTGSDFGMRVYAGRPRSVQVPYGCAYFARRAVTADTAVELVVE